MRTVSARDLHKRRTYRDEGERVQTMPSGRVFEPGAKQMFRVPSGKLPSIHACAKREPTPRLRFYSREFLPEEWGRSLADRVQRWVGTGGVDMWPNPRR